MGPASRITLMAVVVAASAAAAIGADVAPGVEAVWVPASNGAPLPENAQPGGNEPAKVYQERVDPARVYYVCRASVDGALRIGKVTPEQSCELPAGNGRALVDNFQVLEVVDSEWLPWRSDARQALPLDQLVLGGSGRDGRPLYVCRATSICRYEKPNGICMIRGQHPGSLSVAPDGSARCTMAHRSFGECLCHEFDVLRVR